jgi:hypothetical protein
MQIAAEKNVVDVDYRAAQGVAPMQATIRLLDG